MVRINLVIHLVKHFLCSILPPKLSNFGELNMRGQKQLEPLQIPPPSKLKKFKQGHLTYSPFLYSTPLYSPSIQTSYKTYQLGTLTQMEPIPLVRVRQRMRSWFKTHQVCVYGLPINFFFLNLKTLQHQGAQQFIKPLCHMLLQD